MESVVEDSKAQLKALATVRNADPELLYETLSILDMSLVMGMEQYLRRFESAAAIPLLISIIERFIDDDKRGDAHVMSLRALSLIMEHVPSSYDAAQDYHKQIMKLVSTVMHKALCHEWRYDHCDTSMLLEECLRVVRFVGKDDLTGGIIRHAFMGDLLTLCAYEETLMARQALETMVMLCSKVVMPSEFEKTNNSNSLFSLFKSKKKPAPAPENPIVINVENVIAPFLITLVEQYVANLEAMPDVWVLLELTLQCLGSLIERALLCHRPRTARELVPNELPRNLFRLIASIESNVALEAKVKSDRVLFCETLLALVTSCNRALMADSLLLPEAKSFFHDVLESNTEITTLLSDPFPLGGMAARSTQRRDKDHITSIAAIRLFILASPNVPPDAFGLKPKTVLPVHQWLWEDELRHATRLVEEQCLSLETSWSRLSKTSDITVHTKKVPVNLLSMTMARGGSGGYRNLSRLFVPFVYHFADEASLRPVAPVKEAGPACDSAAGGSGEGGSGGGGGGGKRTKRRAGKDVVMNENAFVPKGHIAVAEEYFLPLCDFAAHASGQMAKQLATCACASILQMLFLSDAGARATRLMENAMLPMCEMFREALISADKATKAVVLTMMEWLLRHGMAENWSFSVTALRCGLLNQLDIVAKTTVSNAKKDAKPTRTATLAEKSGTLAGEITEVLREQYRVTTPGPMPASSSFSGSLAMAAPDTFRLKQAVEALRVCCNSPGPHSKAVKDVLVALQDSASITPYEVLQMGLAATIVEYLLVGQSPETIFGPYLTNGNGAAPSQNGGPMQPTPKDASPAVSPDAAASLEFALLTGNVLVLERFLRLADAARVQSFVECATSCPAGLRHLITHLTSTLPLRAYLPLVESLVTSERVLCKTPMMAFQALTEISPQVFLCGVDTTATSMTGTSSFLHGDDAGAEGSPDGTPLLSRGQRLGQAPVSSPPPTAAAASAAPQPPPETAPQDRQQSRGQHPIMARRRPSVEPQTATAFSPPQYNPKEFCMRGHRLRETNMYLRRCVCDLCGRTVEVGFNCSTCNFDVCRDCHRTYHGNPALMQTMVEATAIARNRAHLLTCIGDIERFFRTGSSSTKGTQSSPASQSALRNVGNFSLRLRVYLERPFPHSPISASVAQKLLRHPRVMVRMAYDVLQGYYSRGQLPFDPVIVEGDPLGGAAESSSIGSAGGPEESSLFTTEEKSVALRLMQEAFEDRFILYRPVVGACPYQETFLSVLYRHAVTVGDKQLLLQLENCLLRQESSTDPLSLSGNGLSARSNASPLPTPVEVATATAGGGGGGGAPRTPDGSNEAGATLLGGRDKSKTKPGAPEFHNHAVSKEQCFVFHHFSSDNTANCFCGKHSRAELSTEVRPTLSLTLPDFARRVDLLLLIFLHHTFGPTPWQAALATAGVAATKDSKHGAQGLLASEVELFESTAVTQAVVKAMEASALRVCLLPPHYALPRWVSFVLHHARFLLPLSVRGRLAHYLACDARRSFITYMRLFRQQRFARSQVGITPAEWMRMSNHKFSVSREDFLQDAYTALRKSADSRLPISIEFKGDIGVGQGPTAQFYTLLAKEASRARLQLWRNVGGLPPTHLPQRVAAAAVAVSQAAQDPSLPSSPPPSAPPSSTRRTTRTPSIPSTPGPLTSPSRNPSLTATALFPSGSTVMTEEPLVVPPPEGLYPRPLRQELTIASTLPSFPGSPSVPSGSTHSASSSPASRRRRTVLEHTRVSTTGGTVTFTETGAAIQDFVSSNRDRAMAYYMVGAALGRAFLDEQVLPLQLSAALSLFLRMGTPPYKLVLPGSFEVDANAEGPIDLMPFPPKAVDMVDRTIANSLTALNKMDEATLASLELTFTLPGDDSIEIVPGGSKLQVTSKNLARYQQRVTSALLYESVALPMRLLVQGCTDVVPLEALSVLELGELMGLLCGEEKAGNQPLWTTAEIKAVLVGDHGYQNDSPQLTMLANVLGERLTPKEQRAFLLFCTGCPRLPAGGVRALGAITVVKSSNAFMYVRNMAAAEERRVVAEGGEFDEEEPEGLNPSDNPSDRQNNTNTDPDNSSLPMMPGPGRSSSLMSGLPGQEECGGTVNSTRGHLPDGEWALPSVNTCFRYLKLPPYPNEDLMHKKILLSITQSGDTFELS